LGIFLHVSLHYHQGRPSCYPGKLGRRHPL
jgi:hypothetical protein